MAKSITDNHKKARARGRPKTTGTTPMTGVRLSPNLESAVLKWAQLQADKPSKAEAIRRLVAQALAAKGVARRPPSKEAVRKASKLATRELEKLGSPSLPEPDLQQRKRALIRGPKEFRDIRADLPKPKS
jgi:hypothetical protein